MHAPVLWSTLVLLGGFFPPSSASQDETKKLDPLFDYTNLPPSNEEFWAPVSDAKVLTAD